MRRSAVRQIVGLWLAWAVILGGYQTAVKARYQVQPPDQTLNWTAESMGEQAQQPYLMEPFMNTRVAWDAEFYLSIALRGYDDPQVRAVSPSANAQSPYDRPLSLNYAFFPVYPYLMRLLAIPLSAIGLNPIATATLAGVLISLLGSLAGMLALANLTCDLTQSRTDPAMGLRSAFYLISFPTSFFLAQVYTEGLFIGLSFSSLALAQRQRWIGASILAAIATLTRAVGVGLLIPLLWLWLQQNCFAKHASANHHLAQPAQQQIWKSPRQWMTLIALLLPLMGYLIWRVSFLGGAFQIVEEQFFRCKLFNLSEAIPAWHQAFLTLFGNNSAAIVYYIIEFSAILIGIASCLATSRRYPAISLYGFLIITVSSTCGTAWSLSRYLLTVPSLFLVLSQLGRSTLFDRIWSLLSIMLLGMLAALFSFNFWVG